MLIRFRHRRGVLLVAGALFALAPSAHGAGARSAALDVTITAGPSRVTTETTATFTFEANERATLTCSLDGQRAAPCTSPATYPVAAGPHLFAVTAANARGRAVYTDTARWAWTVEEGAPPPRTPGTDPAPFPLPPDPELETELPNLCARVQVGPAQARGCSATQLALGGPDTLEHHLEDVTALQLELAKVPELATTAASLRDAGADLAALAQRVGQGDPCGDAEDLRGQLAGVDELAAETAALVAAFETDALARDRAAGTTGHGDVGPGEERAFALSLYADRLDDLLAALEGAQSAFDETCAAVTGQLKLTGVVTRIDLARGLIWIGRSKPMALPSGTRLPTLGIGDRVRVIGVRFADGTGAAKGVTEVAAADDGPPAAVSLIPCTHLRVAPLQSFLGSGAPLLHDPAGYQRDGALWLEDGARLAVAKGTCKALDPANGVVWQYAASLQITYTSTFTNAKKTSQLAAALTSKDYPVQLPGAVDPSVTAKLRIGQLRRSCTFAISPGTSTCTDWTETQSTTRSVRVLARAGYAKAHYASTMFTLDDDDQTSFQTTSVTAVDFHPKVPSQGTKFHADGYRVVNGASSYPAVKDITVIPSTQFAVYNHDFYDPEALLFPEDATGVDRPSGLRWPRIEGTRNGHPFRYSVELPSIVRDAITTSCASFYRLPFAPIGWPTWAMGQGNNGSFTHNGDAAFAFDFLAATWTPIVAARGGTVAQVVESSDGNSYYDPNYAGGANKIAIVHQDGTVGRYFHMPTDGVAVVEGQKVHRGQLLGWVGNTGYSTQPHVHFEVGSGPGEPTIQIRFQTAVADCVIPQSGDMLFSNNS